jgi:hypothetical protein
MNQSRLKLEGNIIGYMCESSLDGWNYLTYNKNKNTMSINTYPYSLKLLQYGKKEDIFLLVIMFLNTKHDPLKFCYDTKEECLVDRDKLLDWLRGDNNETNNLNKPVLEAEKTLKKLFEEPLSEDALYNAADYLLGWKGNSELSVRILNCFLNKDASYPQPNNFREVLMMTDAELLRWPNFGRKSLNEFKQWLDDINLKTGMTQEQIEKFLIKRI